MTGPWKGGKSKAAFPTFPPPLGNLALPGKIPTFPSLDCC